jgi:hypothetical protein
MFDTNVKEDLMNLVNVSIMFSERQINPSIIALNRLVLLHGEPGTGNSIVQVYLHLSFSREDKSVQGDCSKDFKAVQRQVCLYRTIDWSSFSSTDTLGLHSWKSTLNL